MSPVPTTSTARLRPQSCSLKPIAYSLAPHLVSAKNHPKRDLPQHMLATRVATEKNPVCHYMSPSILQLLRASVHRPNSPVGVMNDRREMDGI